MQIRCPNCRQPIRFGEFSDDQHEIECPSCHSQISLSKEDRAEVPIANGQLFGHYEIRGMLGQGGFGTVYQAWDSELERFVALKIPRDRSRARANAKAFLREARAAASIVHPNIVSVFEVGIHDEPYLASQYIEGTTLRIHTKENPLLPQQAAELMIQVLSGVQALHDCDVIHRDMKPGNILLDESGRPLVSDFGLAKEVLPDGITVTMDGRIVGTLNYMSPEQASGNHRELGPATDIYSCGVILYELLTGQVPHQANTSKTLAQTISENSPPPLRTFNTKVSSDLQTICQKALANRPQDRYESAAMFAQDLENYIENRPIMARPEGVLKRSSRWMSRNRALAASLSMTCVVLIACALLTRSLLNATPETRVPVVIETSPASQIEFTLYSKKTRLPDKSGFSSSGASGSEILLEPGYYKVVAIAPDGKFHEVWRTVPEKGTTVPIQKIGMHENYEVEAGGYKLPPIQLYSDREIATKMVLMKGGEFEFGYEDNVALTSTKHTRKVDDYWIAIDEVSWDLFRKVMDRPHPGREAKTYLQVVEQRFGSNSEISGDSPLTGYPYEVLVLFAELAGCRLPTHVEYEYAATQGGKSPFPNGPQPSIAAGEDWAVLNVGAPTPDITDAGVRNLYSSVGEFTDSSALPYSILYAEFFPDIDARQKSVAKAIIDSFPASMYEVRGAPEGWLREGTQVPSRNVKKRIIFPQQLIRNDKMAEYYERVGIRLYRSKLKP